jgi:hypothetical protein
LSVVPGSESPEKTSKPLVVPIMCVPRLWGEVSILVLHKPGKKDHGGTRAYRSIPLLPTIGKGPGSIAAAYLSYIAKGYNLLRYNHSRLCKYKSSKQALTVLVECVGQVWRNDWIPSPVTFDVQRARSVLCSRLRQAGISGPLVHRVRSFCEERAGKVIVEQYKTAKQLIAHAGIPYGSPLAPILYIFYNA